MTFALPFNRSLILSVLALLALAAIGAVVVRAQLEGSDRGLAPIDSSSSYEIGGITVDVAAKDPEQARQAGWRLAQRKGWKLLWQRMNGGGEGAPNLGDSALDSIVAGIVVEQEQIGERRYVARLGILFDRTRAGQLLGIHGQGLRSPPMLVIPVQFSGGAPTSFELRNPWQAAWARFRSGGSPIDYVRPVGTGPDSLLLNLGQSRRPGRGWWRMLLDQYGAADIVVPEVIIERQWPGGPIIGRFTARHGPDNAILGRFALRARDGDALEALLDEGVRRIDIIYSDALRSGRMRADPTLVIEEETPPVEEDQMSLEDAVAEVVGDAGTTYTIQIDTPDAAALSAAEAAIRSIPGVGTANTTSLALGGYSVMRVGFSGSIDLLKTALIARGWRVDSGIDALRIRRAPPGGSAAPSPTVP